MAASTSTLVTLRRVEVVRCNIAFLAAGVIVEGGGSSSGDAILWGVPCTSSPPTTATALSFLRRGEVVVGSGGDLLVAAVLVAGSPGDPGVSGISWFLSTAARRDELVRRGSDFLGVGVLETTGSRISGCISSSSTVLFFIRRE